MITSADDARRQGSDRFAKAQAERLQAEKKRQLDEQKKAEDRARKMRDDAKAKSEAAELNKREQIKLRRQREAKLKDSARIDLNVKRGLLHSNQSEILRKKGDLQHIVSKESQLTFAEQNMERAIHGIEMKIEQEASIKQRVMTEEQKKKAFVDEKKLESQGFFDENKVNIAAHCLFFDNKNLAD